MIKTLSVITILFLSLVGSIVHDAMQAYSITNYIDLPFISAIAGLIVLIYAFSVYFTVIHYKYN